MATLEDEIRDLKEKNNELVQKVQYWKMTAADRENDKLNLMKEMNELRLKLSRLRNNSGHEAQKLDSALQQASEKAISHLVKASAEIAKSMEIAKAYIRDRQELDAQSPRWSTLSGTPTTERTDKVHRVPPLMIGGQSIQPVVSLSRTVMNTSNPRTGARSPNQNRSMTERALPMYMLQDVYIPLTRIDISDIPNNNLDNDEEGDNSDDNDELGLEDSGDRMDDSARMSEDDEFPSRRLHALSEEDSDMEEEEEAPRVSLHIDNPLEGPSWLLDSPPDSSSSNPKGGGTLEPDSTTEPDRTQHLLTQNTEDTMQRGELPIRLSCEFSPTVRPRCRKRSSSASMSSPRPHHFSPRPVSARKNSTSGRVLKVLVAKMRLDSDSEGPPPSPKRARTPLDLLTFDAPSPNGATDSAVIVSENRNLALERDIKTEPCTSHSRRNSYEILRCRVNSQDSRTAPESHNLHRVVKAETFQESLRDSGMDSVQCSRFDSMAHDSRDSDSGSGGGGDSITNGRTRRPRKLVTYKEKPLNRKLRR